MNLLTYTKLFSNGLRNGDFYKAPLNQQEKIYHQSIANLLDKAIESSAGIELADDMLRQLIQTQVEVAGLQKKIEGLTKSAETKPEGQKAAEGIEKTENAA